MEKKVPEVVYHYTSYDKLQYILKNGTLRFKESTESNDMLDTVAMVEILRRLKFPEIEKHKEIQVARDFMLDYFRRDEYQRRHASLVSCFSVKGDSRLLWDAYTMNRPSNIPCEYGFTKYCYDSQLKYNGVCIAFITEKLKKTIQNLEGDICQRGYVLPILYGTTYIEGVINDWIGEACRMVMELSKDEDQSQNLIPEMRIPFLRSTMTLKKSIVYPMIEFIGKIEAFSPFFKHEFWHEEDEIRMSLCVDKMKNNSQIQSLNGAMYYDVPITSECIDHVILGPEFAEEEIQKIKDHTEYVLNFMDFKLIESQGTGVIRSN